MEVEDFSNDESYEVTDHEEEKQLKAALNENSMEKICYYFLLELDYWRESIELPPLAIYLKDTIQQYFAKQDFSVYIPGHHVLIQRNGRTVPMFPQ